VKPLADVLPSARSQAGLPDVAIGGLSLDSRRIAPGDAFVALAGRRGHGMKHAAEALAAGARAVIHDGRAEVPADLATRAVEVPGLAQRLHELAARCWDDPAASLDLIAVTGTNGKSSVAWLLSQALEGAMIGTLGVGAPGALAPSTLTTPDVLGLHRALAGLRDAGYRQVVLEASSHALDQRRLAGLRLTSAVFTNLGRDHLDYHGSMAAYGAAKARLFRDYASRRQLVNVDDAFGQQLAAELRGSPGLLRYGLETAHRPDVLGAVRSATLNGLQLDVNTPEGRVCCRTGLIGRINAANVLIVVAELVARGCNLDDVADVVRALAPVPGRMNRIEGPSGQRVVIDYAHSPDALGSALVALREATRERLICVFGCGGDRDRGKRAEMGRIAEALADDVVLTNDNPRHEDPISILRDIQSGMARPERAAVVPDRGDAIARAVGSAGPGDCVLVAGKGHETQQDFGSRRERFSDFDAVSRALTEAA
jgi:UDP-N-acetylmuramoyl-L-alanyl-D-glutamate--2,6-diaminopimelate ligase